MTAVIQVLGRKNTGRTLKNSEERSKSQNSKTLKANSRILMKQQTMYVRSGNNKIRKNQQRETNYRQK